MVNGRVGSFAKTRETESQKDGDFVALPMLVHPVHGHFFVYHLSVLNTKSIQKPCAINPELRSSSVFSFVRRGTRKLTRVYPSIIFLKFFNAATEIHAI